MSSKYYMSNFDTHVFITSATPAAAAAALTGELDSLNYVNGGDIQTNINEAYHIDGEGWADKTPTSRNVNDIEIDFDRAGGSAYSASGTDTYSVLRNWIENSPLTHKNLVRISKRSSSDAYELTYYDVVIASLNDGEFGPDGIQHAVATFSVSGNRNTATATRSSDGTFSWATA